ncbi:MAG: GGDEF and EAL domain-containing protein [Bradyrhizobium sp.]|nr:MAG: GGDEF and EAL domain-containing protein [Bradyrhizobium sp.]
MAKRNNLERPAADSSSLSRELQTLRRENETLLGEKRAWSEELALLTAMIDQVPDHLFVKDTTGRYLRVNKGVAIDLGQLNPDEMIGKSDFDLHALEVARRLIADDQSVIQSGRAKLDIEEFIVDGAGTQKWLSTSKVPLRNSRNEITGLIGVSRDVTRRREAEERVHFLAHCDTLTGLANRNTFYKRLDEAIEAHRISNRRLAVLLLDLDRFKEVNDLLGHAAGDALLQTVARVASRELDNGKGEFMARLGGDEFAIVAPDLSDLAEAGRLAQRVLEAIRIENEGLSTAAPVAASIGVAIFPEDASDRPSLLSHSDTALYRAKSEGRGIYRFFESSMGHELRERRTLECDLRNAIARGELSLVYQPQYRIGSEEPFGFEALLRWRHPTKGDVPPSVFIPLAEESSLILQIGEWVLRVACREAASWPRPLNISVNISAVQLRIPNFAQMIHEILLHTGLPPNRLELEVTESALIQDPNRALASLRQVKALGVRVAMDDFGTGHSSLSNLRTFPFDKIKIDRSFIRAVHRNEQAATIVRAVLGLGRGLGLPVIAEGVETAAELEFLSQELCGEVQGYFLNRPQPIASFRAATHGDSVPQMDGPAANIHIG